MPLIILNPHLHNMGQLRLTVLAVRVMTMFGHHTPLINSHCSLRLFTRSLDNKEERQSNVKRWWPSSHLYLVDTPNSWTIRTTFPHWFQLWKVKSGHSPVTVDLEPVSVLPWPGPSTSAANMQILFWKSRTTRSPRGRL